MKKLVLHRALTYFLAVIFLLTGAGFIENTTGTSNPQETEWVIEQSNQLERQTTHRAVGINTFTHASLEASLRQFNNRVSVVLSEHRYIRFNQEQLFNHTNVYDSKGEEPDNLI